MKLLHSIFDAFNRHDIENVMLNFAEECVFHTHTNKKIVGKNAVREAFLNTFRVFENAHWELGTYYLCGNDVVVAESVFSGTDDSGNESLVNVVDIITFRGDKILVKNAFRKYIT